MNGETKVGLFVLVGSVLLGTAVFLLGNFSFKSYYPINAEFSDVAGLPEKAAVKLSGVEVGKVSEIYLKGDKVVVRMDILEGVRVYRGARFVVGSTSMIGSKFLQIDQGLPSLGIIAAGSTVRGEDTIPLDRAVTRAVASLESLIGDIRGQGKTAESLQAILDNLRDITANVNDLVANGQPHAQNMMASLDSITAKLDSIVAKIDRGDGVAGALVSDPKMKENVNAAITNLRDASASVKDVLGRVNGFRTYLKWDYKYEPQASSSKNDFGIKIYPRDGRYYYIGASNMTNTKDISKGVDYDVKNTVDAQLGWEVSAFDLYAGVLHGSGGAGLRWKPFNNSVWDRLSLLAEASEFSRNRSIKGRFFNSPRYDAGLDVTLNKNIHAGVRVDDIAEVKRVDYTTRIIFEDKDIAYLFGLISFGSAGTKGRSSSK